MQVFDILSRLPQRLKSGDFGVQRVVFRVQGLQLPIVLQRARRLVEAGVDCTQPPQRVDVGSVDLEQALIDDDRIIVPSQFLVAERQPGIGRLPPRTMLEGILELDRRIRHAAVGKQPFALLEAIDRQLLRRRRAIRKTAARSQQGQERPQRGTLHRARSTAGISTGTSCRALLPPMTSVTVTLTRYRPAARLSGSGSRKL